MNNPQPDLSFRPALYARVSSDQQAQEGTIDSQLADLRRRIGQDGLTLEQNLCFIDDGHSGATLLRPALEKLRDAADEGVFDRLYVHSPDRLARSYAHQALIVEELQRCGVGIVFLNRPLNQSPEDNLLLQVQGMVAEYERAKILERSRRGKLHAARCGRVSVLGAAPYGYRYVDRHSGAGAAQFNIHLEEAAVVRRIFQWVGLDRLSIGEVCRRLTAEGVASPKGKSWWDRSTVWGIVQNPAYKGAAAFGKTRAGPRRPRPRAARNAGDPPRSAVSSYDQPPEQWISIPVPALVDEALFAAAAEQLEANRRLARQRQRGARYLLQGLVVCKQCGYAYYGKPVSRSAGRGKQRHYAYYRCTGGDAYRFGGQRVCSNPQVRTDQLEAAVWEDVKTLLDDPQRIEREYQRRLEHPAAGQADAERQRRAELIGKLQRGIARLIDAYGEGLVDKGEFEPRVRAVRERLAKLQAEAEQERRQEQEQRELRLVIGRLEEFAQRVRGGLAEADWQAQRDLIRMLVKRVEIRIRLRPCTGSNWTLLTAAPTITGAVCHIVGGVISPLLANVYLHWFDHVCCRHPEGPLRRIGAKLIRYADDFVLMARRIGPETGRFVEHWLEERMGLKINAQKTTVVKMAGGGAVLRFLGYEFRYLRDEYGRDKRYLYMGASARAVQHVKRIIHESTSSRLNCLPVTEVIEWVNLRVHGWARYFSLGYPRRVYRAVDHCVEERLRQHLSRRSQRPMRPPVGVSWRSLLESLGWKPLATYPRTANP